MGLFFSFAVLIRVADARGEMVMHTRRNKNTYRPTMGIIYSGWERGIGTQWGEGEAGNITCEYVISTTDRNTHKVNIPIHGTSFFQSVAN